VCPIPAQDSSPGPFSGWGAERVPHLRRSDGEPGQAGSSSIDTQPFRVCVRTHSSHKTLTPGRVPLGFPVELVGVGELHAAFLTESRTRSRRLGPRAGNPGRTSVHGLNRTGKALPKLSLQRSHRERSSKSIRKRSYPAHVRWGEHGAPVQGLRSRVA
jgi:hypothetical protein